MLVGVVACLMAMPAPAFTPVPVDFWTFMAGHDHVFEVSIRKARELTDGQRPCGVLHSATIVRVLKGGKVGTTIEFVSAGDVGVGTTAILLLSKSMNVSRKNSWLEETKCDIRGKHWYFGRWPSYHVFPIVELPTPSRDKVVAVSSYGFLGDPAFIQDDTLLVPDEKVPYVMRNFREEYAASGRGDAYFVPLAKLEAMVQK
jgi:hypothetical protein